jgi:hypothetical protein
VALVAAGCGNARHDFRVEKLDPLIQRVSQERTELASTLRLARPHRARDARVLRAQVAQLGASMRRIAGLTPPEGTERKFQRYTRANSALLGSLSRFVDAFGSASQAQQQRAGQEAQAALAVANRTQSELEHALG